MNIPLNINWQQILLHWFNLAILTGGLYFLLYKPVKDFMEKREAYYQNREEESEKCFQNASSKEQELNRRLGEVEEELSKKRKQALAEIIQNRELELAETRKQCEKMVNDAKVISEQERKRIVDGAREEVAQLAIEAMNKLMNSSGTDALEQFLKKEQERV